VPWSLRPGEAHGTQKARSMADVRAAGTEERIGHSGRDDNAKKGETQEHRLKPMLQGRR
jgi:hypothetical protein